MSRGDGKPCKQARDLARVLERRGWVYVRRTGHGASLYRFPTNGARFVVVGTPGNSPPLLDMERKLVKLEVVGGAAT